MTATTATPAPVSIPAASPATEAKLISSALSLASSNAQVQNVVSLLLATYSTSKKYIPSTIAPKVELVENYITSVDGAAIVSTLDNATEEIIGAYKQKKLSEYLTDKALTVAEEIVQPEVEESAAKPEALASPNSSTRLSSLSGTVSKRVIKKASEGLQHVNKRTSEIVHVDLINYASTFIDAQVKPQVAYVSGLPAVVHEKFNDNLNAVKSVAVNTSAQVKQGYSVVQTEFNTRVIDVATEVLAAHKTDSDSVKGTMLIAALGHQARLAWSDFFLVPATAYLGVADLKPSTLYNLALTAPQTQLLIKNFEALKEAAAKFTVTDVIEGTKTQVTVYAVYVQDLVLSNYNQLTPVLNAYLSALLAYLPSTTTSPVVKVVEAVEERVSN